MAACAGCPGRPVAPPLPSFIFLAFSSLRSTTMCRCHLSGLPGRDHTHTAGRAGYCYNSSIISCSCQYLSTMFKLHLCILEIPQSIQGPTGASGCGLHGQTAALHMPFLSLFYLLQPPLQAGQRPPRIQFPDEHAEAEQDSSFPRTLSEQQLAPCCCPLPRLQHRLSRPGSGSWLWSVSTGELILSPQALLHCWF